MHENPYHGLNFCQGTVSEMLQDPNREIIDVNDWDRSVMTNVPGESGVPGDKHYDDLLAAWAKGEYHPMPFSRKAVEAATEERILLVPAK